MKVEIKKPKVSIITINLNNCQGLYKTINSTIEQTFTDFEYIIIDGGSTDGSIEIIKKYSKYINFWISEPDNGIYNAMNKGILNSKGDYCLFLNSGDYLFNKNILNEVQSFLNDNPVVVGKIARDFGNNKFDISGIDEPLNIYTITYMSVPHQASFISRNLLVEMQGFDESYEIVSDWLFFLRIIIEKKIEFKLIDNIVAVYDMFGISSMTSHDEERNIALKYYYPYILEIYPYFKELRYYKLSRLHKLLKLFKSCFHTLLHWI